MFMICPCIKCEGLLEFEQTDVGATVVCPHCGIETVLFIPNRTSGPPTQAAPQQADQQRTGTAAQQPSRQQATIYRFGIDTIIGGAVQYAAPFYVLSETVLKETTTRFCAGGINALRDYPASACRREFDQFLSNFFAFSAAFIEIVSARLADTVRRSTIRQDIRMQTTASLAGAIRHESFAEMEGALGNYAEHAASLGIALGATSTVQHTIGGAFVGGGLEFLLSDGEHSAVGAVAGAILGGMAAEGKKRVLCQVAGDAAIEGVRRITRQVGVVPRKLMDQYVSYVFGDKADFRLRDQETNYGTTIALEVANTCLTVFHQVLTLLDHLDRMARLSVSTCDISELARLPKQKREATAQIGEFLKHMSASHEHLTKLQSRYTAGLVR
jgi:hypothetical protein